MIAIIDYGMGNLRSVAKALEHVGAKVQVTQDPAVIDGAERVILPGVGAMQPAVNKLNDLGLLSSIQKSIEGGKPFLGICLGFQLLFEKSQEGGDGEGLKILQGEVRRFQEGKIPQIGWNSIKLSSKGCPLFQGIKDGAFVYFCHSYYVANKDKKDTAAVTEYGEIYTSAIWKKNLFGVQFHPEKSQDVGLRILENFSRL